MLVRGWWVFEVPLQSMSPWSRVAGSPFPPAHRGPPILPLLDSSRCLRRAASGRAFSVMLSELGQGRIRCHRSLSGIIEIGRSSFEFVRSLETSSHPLPPIPS